MQKLSVQLDILSKKGWKLLNYEYENGKDVWKVDKEQNTFSNSIYIYKFNDNFSVTWILQA